MSTAKYLKQGLITSPSDLEESEIEVLEETISVLKKNLSDARAEIAVLRLDLTNAKSYSNTMENLIEYLISSLQKSACVSSLSSEVTDPSQSKLNQKIISIHTADGQLFGNDPPPPYPTQVLMM